MGSYDLKFTGYEYIHWGSHSDFMKGNADAKVVTDHNELLGPGNTLNTGFNMTAVTTLTTVNKVDKNGTPIFPALYSGNKGEGVYLSILSGLKASFSTGSLNTNDAVMYFTGGVIDWYFIPNALIEDFSNMVYSAGVGLADAMGTLMEKLAGLDPFAQFELAETIEFPDGSKYTGSATMTLDNGYLLGDARFFADTIGESALFDSNLFNGHDLAFQATLKWFADELNRFKVSDPATVHVPTPEPGTLSLMALGLLLTAFYVRSRKRA